MKYEGFVGGAYKSAARIAAADQCENYFVESLEGESSKGDAQLVGRPGYALFAALPTQPGRGAYQINGRVFVASGAFLYEVFADGTFVERGAIDPAGLVAFSANGLQLMLSANNIGYVLTLASNVFTLVGGAFPGGPTLATLDDYTAAIQPNTRTFNISALEDATSWDALDNETRESAADNLVACYADHRELWLFGDKTTDVYWNAGAPDFPLQRIQGAFMEQGCAAALSPSRFDNSFGWLAKNEQGQVYVARANGYTPNRISTHPLETELASYPRVDDAIGGTILYRGHWLYVVHFPSAYPAPPNGVAAGATWAYDASVKLWYRWGYWNAVLARLEAWRPRFLCSAFGKLLGVDYTNGNIYQIDGAFNDDAGSPLRRVRTAPHQYNEGNWTSYSAYWFDMLVGAGLPDGTAAKAALQISNDGGETFGNERYASLGPVGKYKQRVKFRRTGDSRDRVVRLIISDPVPVTIVGAYFDATKGTS